jgi:hypothetical protein
VAQPDGCEHKTGVDTDHGAVTVQLFPYNDTPNPGGVYKVWVTMVDDYKAAARELGVPAGQELNVVNPGKAPGNLHGFKPDDSKVDTFKVDDDGIVEIDTRFYDSSGGILDGRAVTWYDTTGASNSKWSYLAPQLQVFHEAHVEAVEAGFHHIVVANQPGCDVSFIVLPDGTVALGPQTVTVHIKSTSKDLTVFIDVHCK